jgi:hypothetical protein
MQDSISQCAAISHSIPRGAMDETLVLSLDAVVSRTAEPARTYFAVTHGQPRTAQGLVSIAEDGGFSVCVSTDPTIGAYRDKDHFRSLYGVPDAIAILELDGCDHSRSRS